MPAVEKRRYFGFRTAAADGTADNVVHDDLASEYDPGDYESGTYKLGDFILRQGAAADGLARTDDGSGAARYRFYYGLDMRRAAFKLAGLQDLIDQSGDLEYNSAFDQPLLKVKFTFAAARTPGISYFSARMDDGAAPYDAASEAASGAIDAATEITAGAPSTL